MSIFAPWRSGSLAIVFGLLVGVAGTARAGIISVNFVGGQPSGASSVTGTAGAVPAGSWNNDGNASEAAAISIVDSLGAASAAMTYSSPNNWSASATVPGTEDGKLMNGYLDNLQNSGSITITGLGATYTSQGYDVLVYQNADSAGSWGYTVTDNASHTGTRYGQQMTGGTAYPLAGGTNGYVEGTSTLATGDGTASNYIRIRGLTGSSFTITPNSGSTPDGRVRPNGFQIVSVPEPTSLALLGVGSLALLVRRRQV